MSDKPEKDDQTEAPTEKRKREAREKGNVLRSRELATALVMMSGAVYLALAGAWMAESLKNVMRVGLPGIRRGRSEEHTYELQSLMRIWYAVSCLKTKNMS